MSVTKKAEIVEIPVAKIKPSPNNPRPEADFKGKEMDELQASIEASGLAQPVLVRKVAGGYELLAGERRLRSFKALKRATIPAYVRELDDQEAAAMTQIENMHRLDLPPLAEARLFKTMVEGLKNSTQEVAARIGKQPAYVLRRMNLLRLDAGAIKALEDGRLSLLVAEEIARIEDAEDRKQAFEAIDEEGDLDNPKEAKRLIEEHFLLALKDARFDVTDGQLVPKAGACGDCPKRTGAQNELFGGTGEKDICRDAKCWQTKVTAYSAKVIEKHKAEGRTVVTGAEAAKVIEAADHSYSGEYDHLDHHDSDLKGKTTWRQILKASKSKVDVLVAMDDRGVAHELVKRKAALQIAPRNLVNSWVFSGDGSRGVSSRSSEKEKAKVQTRKAELKAVREAWAECWPKALKVLSGRALKGQALRAFVGFLLDHHSDYQVTRGACKRRDKKRTNFYDGNKVLKSAMEKSKGDQGALEILWDAMAADGIAAFEGTRLDRPAEAFLKLAGVDFGSALRARRKAGKAEKKASKRVVKKARPK